MLESLLNDFGISTFDDLLALDEAGEEHLRDELGRFAARIFRRGWRDAVREAREEAEGGPVSPATGGSSH